MKSPLDNRLKIITILNEGNLMHELPNQMTRSFQQDGVDREKMTLVVITHTYVDGKTMIRIQDNASSGR